MKLATEALRKDYRSSIHLYRLLIGWKHSNVTVYQTKRDEDSSICVKLFRYYLFIGWHYDKLRMVELARCHATPSPAPYRQYYIWMRTSSLAQPSSA